MKLLLYLKLIFICSIGGKVGKADSQRNSTDYDAIYASSSNQTDQVRNPRSPLLAIPALMSVPHLSVEYFWKTFVTRFFISQNMKNYDVTTWPGKFYTKGKYHFANRRNWLTALKRTFFLTKTEAEREIEGFLATATQAAILFMSDRSANFLVDKYRKHRIEMNLKELVEPSDGYWGQRQPAQLKTLLEQTFLVDLKRRIIPQLESEARKQELNAILLDGLAETNLLRFMNDLRLLEIDSDERNKAVVEMRTSSRHEDDEETQQFELNEWWETYEGETISCAAITRLFKDLFSSVSLEQAHSSPYTLTDTLLIRPIGVGQYELNTHYTARYYMYGIHLIFRQIVEEANAHLREHYTKHHAHHHQTETHWEIDEEVPFRADEQLEKRLIMNELRRAVCFIFVESVDKDIHELSDQFFPDQQGVSDNLEDVDARLQEVDEELKNEKNKKSEKSTPEGSPEYDSAPESLDNSVGIMETREREVPKARNVGGKSKKKEDAKKQQKQQSGSGWGWAKRLAQVFQPGSSNKKKTTPEESVQASKKLKRVLSEIQIDGGTQAQNKDKGDRQSNSNASEVVVVKKDEATLKRNFQEILLELIDWSRYILRQPSPEKWTQQMEYANRLLCDDHSIVKIRSDETERMVRRKTDKVCEELAKQLHSIAAAKKGKKSRRRKSKERRDDEARTTLKQKFHKVWRKSIEAVQSLIQKPKNKFLEFTREKCNALNDVIEQDNALLMQTPLSEMPLLRETPEQRSARMSNMIKKRCLFKLENLHPNLRRFFQLETDGIVKITWPQPDDAANANGDNGEDGEQQRITQGDGSLHARVRRFVITETLFVLAMVEPIIETTVLQQIFRQWNFYKWFGNCIRRSWRYKELRCKEPVVLAEENRFIQGLTSTVFEELSTEGIDKICSIYKEYVNKHLMPLKEVVIKYPSALLKQYGFKLGTITKELMDSAWQKKNALPCMLDKDDEQLADIWTHLAQNAKEQRLDLDDAWAQLAEFLTLSSKQQQQLLVVDTICPGMSVAKRAECLHEKLWEIAKGADTQRELKTRAKSAVLLKQSSANKEVILFFEMLLLSREKFFVNTFGIIMAGKSQINMELLLLSMFSLSNWNFIDKILSIYAGIKSRSNFKMLIRRKMEKALNTAEMEPRSKFMLEILKERFELIVANNGKPIEGRNIKHDQLYWKCMGYKYNIEAEGTNETTNNDEQDPQKQSSSLETLKNEIIHKLIRELIIPFDGSPSETIAQSLRESCGNILNLHIYETVVEGETEEEEQDGLMKSRLKQMREAAKKPPKVTVKEQFISTIKQFSPKKSEKRQKDNNLANETNGENLNENLKVDEKLDVLQQILMATGILGVQLQHKLVATKLREAVLNTRFADARFILAQHVGIDFAKILESHEGGGIKGAVQEAGLWRITGDKEGDSVKKKFAKIYATILKQYAINLVCVQKVEMKNGENENTLYLRNALRANENVLEIMRIQIDILKSIKRAYDLTEHKQETCARERTESWIVKKFEALLFNANDEAEREAIMAKLRNPPQCIDEIVEVFERILTKLLQESDHVQHAHGEEHHGKEIQRVQQMPGKNEEQSEIKEEWVYWPVKEEELIAGTSGTKHVDEHGNVVEVEDSDSDSTKFHSFRTDSQEGDVREQPPANP